MISNVVNKETLRRVQIETMNSLKDILLKSFGPYGSNSIIYSGKDALPRYTKDGHTILGSIQFNDQSNLQYLQILKKKQELRL